MVKPSRLDTHCGCSASRFDLVVIGSGIGGYPAAVAAANAGLRVAVVEERLVGGECVNYGCVPSKALIHYARVALESRRLGILDSIPSGLYSKALSIASRTAAEARSGLESLLEAVGVELIRARGIVKRCAGDGCEVEAGGRSIEASWVLAATGSEPVRPKWVEWCEHVLDNRGLFEHGLPDGAEKVAVIGGGVAGVEIAQALAALGLRVDLYEAMPRILPTLPESLSRIALRALRYAGVAVYAATPVEKLACRDGRVFLRAGSREDHYDAAILLLGRRPRRDAFEHLGFRGRRGVAADGLPRLLVAGDAAGPPFLAHRALAESIAAAAHVLGVEYRLPRVHPTVVYTTPELLDVSSPEPGGVVKSIRFYWGYATPARIEGIPASLVYAELGYRESDGKIVYVRLAGPGVSNLAGEAALLVERGLSVYDVSGVEHAHPTSSEVLLEAVLEAMRLVFNRAVRR